MDRDSQALRVRYVGPTNTKPARVIVTESVPAHMGRNPSHTMDWQDDLDPRENRLLAAQEYLDQYFKPCGPERLCVNPNGLCFDGDYFYTWQHQLRLPMQRSKNLVAPLGSQFGRSQVLIQQAHRFSA